MIASEYVSFVLSCFFITYALINIVICVYLKNSQSFQGPPPLYPVKHMVSATEVWYRVHSWGFEILDVVGFPEGFVSGSMSSCTWTVESKINNSNFGDGRNKDTKILNCINSVIPVYSLVGVLCQI